MRPENPVTVSTVSLQKSGSSTMLDSGFRRFDPRWHQRMPVRS